MKLRTNNELEMLKRVSRFILDNPITPPNRRVTELGGQINTAITSVQAAAQDQVEGNGEASGGVATRAEKYTALRDYLKDVCRVARSLDRETHPGIAEQFVLPRTGAYNALIASAQAMINAAGAIKAPLIAHGLPSTFLADLDALIADFVGGSNAKYDGQQTQVGGTSGLTIYASEGVKAAQKLDAIIRAIFRNDPVKLDIWAHARHIQAAPEATTTPPSTPPPGGKGSGLTAAITTVPATAVEGGPIA